MTVGTNSYSSAANVAALATRWTASGNFNAATNPTLTTVEGWIDGASATMNVFLAKAGFTIPVSQADAKASIAEVIAEVVAERVRYANGAGRFYTQRAVEYGIDPMQALRNEMAKWVEDNADGLAALGAARSTDDLRSNTLTAGVITLDISEHDDYTSTIESD